jgi:hypothetical protein
MDRLGVSRRLTSTAIRTNSNPATVRDAVKEDVITWSPRKIGVDLSKLETIENLEETEGPLFSKFLRYAIHALPTDVCTEYWIKAWSGDRANTATIKMSTSLRCDVLVEHEAISHNLSES